jgi:FKBP-type peptidyl-prolyl cis-trans isomerase
MKILQQLYFCLILAAGLFVMVSCTEENTDQDALAQEERFFEIYVGANYAGAIPQSSGLYYIENKEGTGDMPGDSSWVLINHVAYTLPDEAVFDTYIERVAIDHLMEDTLAMYGPFKMRNGSLNEGFSEGLTLMKEGGEATFLFTSELGYGSTNTGSVGAYRSLKYEVVLLEVLGDDIEAFEAGKILDYTDTIIGIEAIYDETTEATMFYVVDSVTDGAPVAIDSTIQVAYKGYLTDGRVFDESPEDNYYQFKVGDYTADTSPIAGWHLGLEKFKKGEKGRLIIPHTLAYGELGKFTNQGNVAIPAYEILVFEVEVVSVDPDEEEEDPGEEL